MKEMVTAVAEHLNQDPVDISQGMQKLEAQLRRDGTLHGAVKEIKETLTRNRKRKYLIIYVWPSPFSPPQIKAEINRTLT
jgi:hypothetical protein